MVKEPRHTERITVTVVRADPDGTWIIKTGFQPDHGQERFVYKQINGSEGFEMDGVAAWQIHDVVVDHVSMRLF